MPGGGGQSRGRCPDCAGQPFNAGSGLCSACYRYGHSLWPELEKEQSADPCWKCGGSRICRTCRGSGYSYQGSIDLYADIPLADLLFPGMRDWFNGAPRRWLVVNFEGTVRAIQRCLPF